MVAAAKQKFVYLVDTSYNYNVKQYGTEYANPKVGSHKFQGSIFRDIDTLDLSNAEDRWRVAKRDAAMNRATFQAARMIFNSGVKFWKDVERKQEYIELEKKWVETRSHEIFREFYVCCCVQGNGIIAKTKSSTRTYTQPNLDVKRNSSTQEIERFDVYVTKNGSRSGKPTPFKPDVVVFRSLEDYEHDDLGTSRLMPAWDNILWKHLMIVSMAEYDVRLGSGVVVLKVPLGTPDDEINRMKGDLENLTSRKYFVAKVSTEAGQEKTLGLDTVKPGQVDYVAHLDVIKSEIACALGFPKRYLEGDAEGALAAAAEDGLALKDKLEAEFDEFTSSINEYCEKFLGMAPPAAMDPNIQLRMDEQEVETLEGSKISNKLKYMTVDEIRAEKGLKKAPKQEPTQPEAPKMKESNSDGAFLLGKFPLNDGAVPVKMRNVVDNKDEWVMDATITRAGIFDYYWYKIHRDRATMQKAVDYINEDGFKVLVGMYHEDGPEVRMKNAVGYADNVHLSEDGTDSIDCTFHVKKKKVSDWFANPDKAHPIDWLTHAIETNQLIPVSIGGYGHTVETTDPETLYQDDFEVRSVCFVDQGRCSTPACGAQKQ